MAAILVANACVEPVEPPRCTPPGAFARDHEQRQVSWLAGHGFQNRLPGRVAQWLIGLKLAAYSCGGSRGIGREARTAFPFDPRREPLT